MMRSARFTSRRQLPGPLPRAVLPGRPKRTGGNALVSSQPNKVSDLEILPALHNPHRLADVLAQPEDVGKVGDVHELAGLLTTLERLSVFRVLVKIALLAVRHVGNKGFDLSGRRRGHFVGRLVALRGLRLRAFDGSAAWSSEPAAFDRASPLLELGKVDLALPPEPLATDQLPVLLGLLGLLLERAAEEEVANEGRDSEGAGLGVGEVGVVVAAAEGEDLQSERKRESSAIAVRLPVESANCDAPGFR